MKPKWYKFIDKYYEGWIRKEPCLVCQSNEVHCHHVDHARRNAYMSVPLCPEHHTMGPYAYHIIEREAFEEKHKLNLDWEIMKLMMKYIQKLGGNHDETL